MNLYKLKKDMPGLKAGAIFVHKEWSVQQEGGNVGCGALVLAWRDGNCQQNWCGGAIVVPGQLAKDTEWFEPFTDHCGCGCPNCSASGKKYYYCGGKKDWK